MTIKQLVKFLTKNNQQIELYHKSSCQDCTSLKSEGDCYCCEYCDALNMECTYPNPEELVKEYDATLFEGRPFEIPICYADSKVISVRSEYYYPYKKCHGPESKLCIEIEE